MSKTYEIIRRNDVAAIGEQFTVADFDPKKGKLKKLGTLDVLLKDGLIRALTPSRRPVAEPIAEVAPTLDPKP